METRSSEHVRWFADQVRPHEAALRCYVRSAFPSLDVDDIVQESYLKLLRVRAAGRIISTKAYLFAIARLLWRIVLVGVFASLLSLYAHAQNIDRRNYDLPGVAAPRPAQPADPLETIVLSPFEVRTDLDTGFVATTSLAGGRLAGRLQDTPVAYSVLTRSKHSLRKPWGVDIV